MRIAIDLSTLQTGHRMRGIGAVLISFINNLSASDKREHEFIFFLNPGNDDDVLSLLNVKDLQYSLEYLRQPRKVSFTLPSKLNLFIKLINKIISYREYHTGDSRIRSSQLHDIDAFLQFDQSQKLPKQSREHTVVVLYDLIPYVMESDYLWSYKTARQNGRRRRSALKSAVKRRQYLAKLKASCSRAKHLIAISEHTKQDFVRYAGIDASKISVALLGSDTTPLELTFTAKDADFSEYKSTVWGSIPRPLTLGKKPFMLFVGGADPRRRLVELAAAYNNLRARGYDIDLVLAGDTMFGAEKVPHAALQAYLRKNASYSDGIHFLGFVTDRQKAWLYKNALAYVYPSSYEGFGLPVLEAMQYGTPVITYKNSSIGEIAGNNALYATDFLSITALTEQLLNQPHLRKEYGDKGRERSKAFTWHKTTAEIMKIIKN